MPFVLYSRQFEHINKKVYMYCDSYVHETILQYAGSIYQHMYKLNNQQDLIFKKV